MYVSRLLVSILLATLFLSGTSIAIASILYHQPQPEYSQSDEEQALPVSAYIFVDVFSDSNGDKYSLASSSTNSIARRTINKALSTVFATSYGNKLCRYVLYSKDLETHASNLHLHVGLSMKDARRFAQQCRILTPFNKGKYFYFVGETRIHKKSLFRPTNKTQQQKNYTFLFTKQTRWAYDSWTDASNQTFIVIEDNQDPDSNQNNHPHIVRTIAHEIAVYFDSKQIVGTDKWDAIIARKAPHFLRIPNRKKLNLALNNPLIQQVLTTWRALIFERSLIGEIPAFQNMSVKPEPIDQKYNFLFEDSCKEICLFKHLSSETHALTHKALFISAMRPEYRTQKWQQYLEDPHSFVNKEELKKVLITYPSNLLNIYLPSLLADQTITPTFRNIYPQGRFGYSDFFYLLIDPAAYQKNIVTSFITGGQYRSEILPKDLDTIWLASEHLNHTDRKPLLGFLKEPLLSSSNVDRTFGPRPRIRTGSIGGGGVN